MLEIGNGAISSSVNDNIYETGENGAKISSISHSNGPFLVIQLRESHAKWERVGKPAQDLIELLQSPCVKFNKLIIFK